MKLHHHKTPGVFQHLINSAAFFDVIAVNVWGKRRTTVLDHVAREKNRPIGGYGRAYARCIPGLNRRTGNPLQIKYGLLLPYRNISPFFVIVWAGRLPVTWADLSLVIDAFLQRGWRARVSWAEVTFDTSGFPFDIFSWEICTTARTIREFEGEHGNTLYVGGSNSSWRMKIYHKTHDVVRNEFTFQARFLRKCGITKPEELSLLRKAPLWKQVSFRKVDLTHGHARPRSTGDPWAWLGDGLTPADLQTSVALKTLRDAHIDPKGFTVRSAREKLLRRMQGNLIW
jgi:hypothetical protein